MPTVTCGCSAMAAPCFARAMARLLNRPEGLQIAKSILLPAPAATHCLSPTGASLRLKMGQLHPWAWGPALTISFLKKRSLPGMVAYGCSETDAFANGAMTTGRPSCKDAQRTLVRFPYVWNPSGVRSRSEEHTSE